MRNTFYLSGPVSVLIGTACVSAAGVDRSFDVVVYGGTSAGVVAALQASQMGRSVVLVEPGRYLGGLTTGGLGATDIGNKAAIGGIAREFYRRVGRHYGQEEAWKFEPHVAQKIVDEMARESSALIVRERGLASVEKDGTRIVAITTTAGDRLTGRMFIDATYEGDLMARAGVSYHVGRESGATYGESLNGIRFGQKHHRFEVPVDPWRVEGDPASGLLPRISPEDPGREGDGDHRVQAYCFRMCLTKRPENRLPFPKPEGYDRDQYALLARYLQKADAAGVSVHLMNHVMMPNDKTDTNNNGGFSTDNIGMNYAYPDGDPETRRRIIKEHEVYQKGFMYFLANDTSVPERVRKEVGEWGLCKDEFTDNGGWPHQLYIREARRMISECVMTQHHCQYEKTVEDAVGMAAYQMDSHNCQRFARDGQVLNEGDIQVAASAPYPIAYRSIVPRRTQCTNLVVPICLSASHIAYGSIRMEPVFMILGQSAATAACLAIDADQPLQELSYDVLRRRLLSDGQVLEWKGPVRRPRAAVKLSGIIIDDEQAILTGEWMVSSSCDRFVGTGYEHDLNSGKGEKSARFPVKVDRAGTYRVRLSIAAHPNRATNVPVKVHHARGTVEAKVNQRAADKADTDGLVTLGEYPFEPARPSWVEISNKGTDGYVTADAVQLLLLP